MKKEELEKINFEGWPLPNEYLIEIGRVATLWALLESFLNICLGKLAGFDLSDPKHFILFNHSSFPQKIDMLGALCEQLAAHFPQLKGYADVISKLKTAQKNRNKFLHNGMALNPETGKIEMAQGSARGKLKTAVEIIEVTEIKRAIIEIDEAQSALYKLVLGKDIGPLWKRRQSPHHHKGDGA